MADDATSLQVPSATAAVGGLMEALASTKDHYALVRATVDLTVAVCAWLVATGASAYLNTWAGWPAAFVAALVVLVAFHKWLARQAVIPAVKRATDTAALADAQRQATTSAAQREIQRLEAALQHFAGKHVNRDGSFADLTDGPQVSAPEPISAWPKT